LFLSEGERAGEGGGDRMNGAIGAAVFFFEEGIVYLGRLKICRKVIMRPLKSVTARYIV
jgi:hypothetical protein